MNVCLKVKILLFILRKDQEVNDQHNKFITMIETVDFSAP